MIFRYVEKVYIHFITAPFYIGTYTFCVIGDISCKSVTHILYLRINVSKYLTHIIVLVPVFKLH